ncbi:hypothetical protein [Aquibacillus saliphilus]|uniref:hypothetical protein n=1 Tax=Aquibacillus saliphilus TaxID=1909422 RepID=UPI001CEFDC23|nr:hypothetical protein [Aquibacillus saliphilus]
MKKCSFQFCTLDSLFKSMDGDVEDGLVFSGARVHEFKSKLPVKKIMDLVIRDYQSSKVQAANP